MPSLAKTKELFGALALQKGGANIRSVHHALEVLQTGESIMTDDSIMRFADDVVDVLDTVIRSYQAQGYDVLLVTAPPHTTSTSTYGSYSLPYSLKKRQFEEPLEDLPLFATESVNETYSATASDTNNNTTPLRGILPFCYSTRSACESTTRNCTGHGSCTLAYTQLDNAGDGKGTPCYSCSCVASVRKNDDGTKKTTVWGGPACQKKDVVAPFWLLAGFSVVMMFLVSWGIGLLFSMGEEQLPSVIGAGVSGVPRK